MEPKPSTATIGNSDDYNLDPDQGVDNEIEMFTPAGSTAVARFEYPKVWKTTSSEVDESGMMKSWVKLKEPLSENSVFSKIEISATPVEVKSVKDFGRPEDQKYLNIITKGDSELQQADLMGVEVREDDNGIKYYDYKLAYSPKTCSYEESKYYWGTCPIKTLAYVSTTVVEVF